MTLYRVGHENGDKQKPNEVPLEIWLRNLENERDCCISRLRHIDKVLVEYGRLKSETIPRRIR